MILNQKEANMAEARKQEPTADGSESEWVSLNEATKLLGANRETVLQLGLSGRLKVRKMGRWTFVTRESIDRHQAATVE